MPDKPDHTAAIFEKLGITPETQPWAYVKTMVETFTLAGKTYCDTSKIPRPEHFEPISLLSSTLDGLGWKLLDMLPGEMCYTIKTFNLNGAPCLELIIYPTYKEDCDPIAQRQLTGHSKAHAVHDALVEVLEITPPTTP